MTHLVDARGKITTFTFDGAGRRLSEENPLHKVRTSSYDPAGNVTEQTDPRPGSTGAFEYDDANHRTHEAWADGRTVDYEYDQVGNRTKVIESARGTTTTTYDELNQTVSHQVPEKRKGVGSRCF